MTIKKKAIEPYLCFGIRWRRLFTLRKKVVPMVIRSPLFIAIMRRNKVIPKFERYLLQGVFHKVFL